MSDQGDRLNSSSSGQLVSSVLLVRVDYARPPTSEGYISFVRTPIQVFLDSMESPLSQEYIDMPEENIRCYTDMIDRTHPVQVNSSVQFSSSGLTTHDLQLRKVISPSFGLRFGCSWTLWKSH